MPDQFVQFKIDKKTLASVNKNLDKIDFSMKKFMTKSIEDVSELIVDHAKGKHFFVGTGKGSSQKAKKHELKFVNPDGTPRFKVRTNNLLNSIQARVKVSIFGVITGRILAGMEYAKDVEFGGPGRRAFPYLRPALEAKRRKFNAVVKNNLKRALLSVR